MLKLHQIDLHEGGTGAVPPDGAVMVVAAGAVRPSTSTTSAMRVPAGTTVQRPAAPDPAHLRYNNESFSLESPLGALWYSVTSYSRFADDAAASTASFGIGQLVHLQDDGNGNAALFLITDVVDGAWSTSTKLSITDSVNEPVLANLVQFYTDMAADLNAVNTSAPTSALVQAINDGLITFNNALGQGTLDLPNVT